MRKLVITENITLDGVIEATDGWFGPSGPDDSGDLQEAMQRQMAAEGALLLGRQTFEDFQSYWPKQTDDTTGVTAHLNGVAKYVVSNSLTEPEWENTEILRGDLTDEVQALKEQPGQEIGVTGSITLVHALIAAGLVDEYRLFFYPVVVGRGRRLFEEGANVPKLELIETESYQSGIVLLTYKPATVGGDL